jgi:hypothetical protein
LGTREDKKTQARIRFLLVSYGGQLSLKVILESYTSEFALGFQAEGLSSYSLALVGCQLRVTMGRVGKIR